MTRLNFPTFSLDLAAELIEIDGATKRLRPKTWSVFLYLVHNPGRVVTKEELLQQVWPDTIVSEDMPRISIGELRTALGDAPRSPTVVETVHGRGYRLLVKPRSTSQARRPSIAVFPFVPDIPNPDIPSNGGASKEAHLVEQAREIGELLVQSLAGILGGYDEVDVAASGSVHTSLARYLDLRQQARSLQVDHVLGGTIEVQEEDGLILVQAKITRPATSKIVWKRGFSSRPDKLVELQERLAEEITDVLRGEDQPPSGPMRLLQRSKDASAYHLYLRGLRLQNIFETQKWERAANYYSQAIELEPDYAPPWTGLAAVALLKATAGTASSNSLLEEAENHSRRALDLDPDLPEGHCTQGMVELLRHWNFAESERRLRTAITLRPSFAMAYYSYQVLLRYCARHKEAQLASQRAFELDPLSPIYSANLGISDMHSSSPEAALNRFEEALTDDANNVMAHLGRGTALRELGDWPGALKEFEFCQPRISGRMVPVLIAHTLALSGQHDQARKKLKGLANTSRAVPKTYLAIVFTGLGDYDASFDLLNQAVDARERSVLNLVDAVHDPLRGDARLLAIVRRIGLPDAVAKEG